jgi:hypothetical protein
VVEKARGEKSMGRGGEVAGRCTRRSSATAYGGGAASTGRLACGALEPSSLLRQSHYYIVPIQIKLLQATSRLLGFLAFAYPWPTVQ